MQTPVVLYDWVSPEGFRQYLQNETHAQQAMDNFWSFLTRVEKRGNPENIIVLGHSMGALFVDEAMVRRSIQYDAHGSAPQLKQIILSNPDLDAATFLNHAEQFAGNAKSTLVFLSRDDDRLRASALAHGGYPRLGAPGSMAQELSKVKGITAIDITDADSGHEIPFQVLAYIHKNGLPAPNSGSQMQTPGPRNFAVIKPAKEN
jgi:esterase/lipase superfamily enzyme